MFTVTKKVKNYLPNPFYLLTLSLVMQLLRR